MRGTRHCPSVNILRTKILLVDFCSCNTSSTLLDLPTFTTINNISEYCLQEIFQQLSELNMFSLTVALALVGSWITYLVLLAIYRGLGYPWLHQHVSLLNLNPSLLQSSSEISRSSNGRYVKSTPYRFLLEYMGARCVCAILAELHLPKNV